MSHCTESNPIRLVLSEEEDSRTDKTEHYVKPQRMVANSKSKRQAARRNQLGIPSAWISKASRTMLRSVALIIIARAYPKKHAYYGRNLCSIRGKEHTKIIKLK